MNRLTQVCASSVLLVAAVPCFATVVNKARVIIQPDFAGGAGPVDNLVTHSGACDSTASSTGGFGSSGSGVAHTVYGHIAVSGSSSGSLSATGSGEFNDTITINSPGVPTNTQGTLTFTVRVAGQVNADAGSSASTWVAQMNLNGGVFDFSKSGSFFSPALPNSGYVGDPFGTYTTTITFPFGQPLPIVGTLRCVADAAYSTTTNPGSASFGSPLTFTWLGITNVNINGNPVTTVNITSESGTNWGGDLTPITCDTIDFNGDGLYPDTADIDDFLSVFSGGPCSTGTCGDIDFNNDGLYPDTADIDALLSVFSGGSCF